MHGQLSKHSDWLQACLPHTSMSSVLLVGQAYMWAHGHGKSGGLDDQHDRHAADLLCRGLVQLALGGSGGQVEMEFKVCIDPDCMLRQCVCVLD